MSNNNFVVATMRKFKEENLGGIEIHNERKTKNHSNKDIDVSKKNLNLDLVTETGSYQKRVSDQIMRNRKSDRKVRKDAVVSDYIISCVDGAGESPQEVNVKARGKRQRDAVGQPLPLLQERDTEPQGKAGTDFPTPSRRVRGRSSWLSLWVWVKPT